MRIRGARTAGYVHKIPLICQYLIFRSESQYSASRNVVNNYSCVHDLIRAENSVLQSLSILNSINILFHEIGTVSRLLRPEVL